jgi:molybdopterin/thiamine biosynthesis adenylyltransferase
LGKTTLIGKKIGLVGCGTIGGYLARLLVQSGAGCEATLHLYDTDALKPGNLGRHLLGFEDLGKPKAQAVAAYLGSFHPDVQVKPLALDATKDWAALERMDLIIDATGEPNVSTVLNDLWIKSTRSGQDLALLHSWVFGNGVAGQSFLNLKDGHACYRCLKTGFDGQWRHNPLKDPKSPLIQAPARCGEAGYVPFGVDAPVAAASLTLRAALDWAGGQPGQRLRTTIVDHDAGREKAPWASPDALKDCSACGG